MEIVKTTSAKWRLDVHDFIKGAVVAIGAAIALPLQAWADALATGAPVALNYKHVAMTGLGAFAAYLIKNLLTPAQTIVNPGSAPQKTD
jgi:hypothetical protein